MATPTIFDQLTDFVTDTYNAATAPIDLIASTTGNLFNVDYTFKQDVFPEDLGSEYIGHYMIMQFYTQGQPVQSNYGPISRGYSMNNYNVALFMPSELGGGIFPVFEDTHEYADISMTNVFLNQIGAAKTARALAAGTGRAINPGVQVLYKSTQLRTFDFSFLFAPRSENESNNMKSIIKNVRKYSAPKDEGAFYRSPAEVDISFHFNGSENTHIIRMKRQVVTSTTVQYSPQGYSTFTNGHPVTCSFSMRTREMEIIDRDDVEAGF